MKFQLVTQQAFHKVLPEKSLQAARLSAILAFQLVTGKSNLFPVAVYSTLVPYEKRLNARRGTVKPTPLTTPLSLSPSLSLSLSVSPSLSLSLSLSLSAGWTGASRHP